MLMNLTYAKIKESDLDYLLSLEKKPENSDFIMGWPYKRHLKSLNNPDIDYRLIYSEIGELVGFYILAGLISPEKSIEILRIVIDQKEKGYGRKVLQDIIDYSFIILKANRVWLDVKEKNKRAFHLYSSLGFIQEAYLREAVKNKNHYEDLILMSLLKEEFLSLKV